MLEFNLDPQEIRVQFWQRLLRGESVSTAEIDALLPLVRESMTEARQAFVLLRACAQIMSSGSESAKRNLRGMLMYWFSHAGTRDDSGGIVDCLEIQSLMGHHLSWCECIRHVGGNPNAYSARSRTIQQVQEAVREQWMALFGEHAPIEGDTDVR